MRGKLGANSIVWSAPYAENVLWRPFVKERRTIGAAKLDRCVKELLRLSNRPALTNVGGRESALSAVALTKI